MKQFKKSKSKIEEIRPSLLMTEAKRAYLKDAEFYKINLDKFEMRVCPGCGLDNYSHFCIKDSFSFKRCNSCLTIFMNPGPSQYLVDELYKKSENYKYWAKYIYPNTEENRLQTLHLPRANWIKDNLIHVNNYPKDVNLFEIGAGDGGTLKAIHKIDPAINLFAYEPNPDSLNLVHTNFIKIINRFELDEKNVQRDFSIISSFEVLEHTLHPSSIFALARMFLRNGGLLMCTTPNALSLEVGSLRDSSTTIDIEHISILTPIAIFNLCKTNGFKLLKIETPGNFDIELIGKSSNFSFLKNLSEKVSEKLQNALKESLLSSHMRFVAIKQES